MAIVLAGLALSLAPVAYADERCDRHGDGDGHDHPETCRAAAAVAMLLGGALLARRRLAPGAGPRR